MKSTSTSRTRKVVAVATAALTGAAGVALLGPATGNASSHREAPFIAGAPQLDNTDVYAFVSPDDTDTVTVVANWSPFSEPNGGPNFYAFADGAYHDINIDSNGDAKPDLTYRFEFSSSYQNPNTFLYNTGPVDSLDDPDLNFRQTYSLTLLTAAGRAPGQSQPTKATTTRLLSGAPVAPSNVGAASMPDYAFLRDQAVTELPRGGKAYAGQAEDPFFLDLRVFDLLYGGNLSEVGQDTLAGYNVNTIVLQVPKRDLALNGDVAANPVIGVWSTTSTPKTRVLGNTDSDGGVKSASENQVQVSRLGNPLVNEVVVPVGAKDRFNASTPENDGQFAAGVLQPELPKLIEVIYGVEAPAEPRNDLAEVFLTGICKTCGPIGSALNADLNSQKINRDAVRFVPSEQLRLNMTVPVNPNPERLGALAMDFQGYPNGRRLGDDVVDIALKVVEGALPPYNKDTSVFSDAVDTNDAEFSTTFPYVGLPFNKAVNQ